MASDDYSEYRDQAFLDREVQPFKDRGEEVATHTDLRQVLDDYITDARWRKILSWFLLAFWLVISLIGAVAIIGGVRPV